VQKIDAHNASFWAAKSGAATDSGLGLMDRQRVKMWLCHAYSEIAKAGA